MREAYLLSILLSFPSRILRNPVAARLQLCICCLGGMGLARGADIAISRPNPTVGAELQRVGSPNPSIAARQVHVTAARGGRLAPKRDVPGNASDVELSGLAHHNASFLIAHSH